VAVAREDLSFASQTPLQNPSAEALPPAKAGAASVSPAIQVLIFRGGLERAAMYGWHLMFHGNPLETANPDLSALVRLLMTALSC
jgi:hypothetical protein